MTSETRIAIAVAAVVVASAWTPARAESRAEEDVTPLALLRVADAVVVAAPAAGGSGLVVETALVGPLAAGSTVVPLDEGGLRPLVPPSGRVVALLRRSGVEGWEVPGGPLGWFPAGEGPGGGAAADLFRALAAARELPAPAARTAGQRAALVAAVRDGDARLRAGAALDLLTDPATLADATEAERAALAAAFRACGPRERARAHLAPILGRVRAPGAAADLLGALEGPGGDVLAAPVGAGLALLEDRAALDALAARAVTVDPGMRLRVAVALAATRHAAVRPALASLLGDGDVRIRREAATGLGALRSADAAPALLARFLGEGAAAAESAAPVRRALAWALAQCDAPEAWTALRDAVERDPDDAFRAFVRDTLANPRRAFVR